MAVKIRLLRVGKKKQPYYRVVVADGRSPRDGRIIERIGRYSPLDEPSLVEIDSDRAVDWLTKGAQPTEAVQKLLESSGIWAEFQSKRPGASSAAQKAIAHHKVALANRPEPEPEPEPAPEPAAAEAPEEGAADDAPADAADESPAEESGAEESAADEAPADAAEGDEEGA